jgi:hypothetical protein
MTIPHSIPAEWTRLLDFEMLLFSLVKSLSRLALVSVMRLMIQ